MFNKCVDGGGRLLFHRWELEIETRKNQIGLKMNRTPTQIAKDTINNHDHIYGYIAIETINLMRDKKDLNEVQEILVERMKFFKIYPDYKGLNPLHRAILDETMNQINWHEIALEFINSHKAKE